MAFALIRLREHFPAYPLARPFLFVFAGARPSAAARDFVSWIVGPAGRALTRREGLLPPKT